MRTANGAVNGYVRTEVVKPQYSKDAAVEIMTRLEADSNNQSTLIVSMETATRLRNQLNEILK